MNITRLIVATVITLAASTSIAADHDHSVMKQQAATFMDQYLAVYNRRFGKPENSEQFRNQLAGLVTEPLMQSPPMGQPIVPASTESFTQNFERFLTMLEGRGVTKLKWAKTEFRVLTKNKILVNNFGHGINQKGEVAYRTVSLYLLHRTEGGWRIALFSPYSTNNAACIQGEVWQ